MPEPLYIPMSFPIMKLYVHYQDAWWRNDLGLVSGPFVNGNPGPNHPVSAHGTALVSQDPAPLQGQYHDGDVRCDLPGGKCRGYLQAFYSGGDAIKYYAPYVAAIREDAATTLSP